MPSRQPPSQRDPEYAMHRLPRLFSQVLPGVRVRNASPVTKTPPRRRPEAAGVLGYAEVTVAFPTSFLSTGLDVANTGVTVGVTTGSPGVSTSGNDVAYAAGLYAVNAVIDVIPDFATCTATDVHDFEYTGDSVMGAVSGCSVGTAERLLSFTGLFRLASASTSTSTLVATSTGGTARQYRLSGNVVNLYIIRFAAT